MQMIIEKLLQHIKNLKIHLEMGGILMMAEELSKVSSVNKLKRTGVQIMPRAIPCTSSNDPARGSLGAFALLVVSALNLGGLI